MTDDPRDLAIDAAVLFTDAALPFGKELCIDEFNHRLALAFDIYAARKVAEERERIIRLARKHSCDETDTVDVHELIEAIRKEPS